MNKSNAKVNYVYSIAYSILTMILPFVTAPYISRIVGAKGLGIYSYNYTIATYFATFASLGINFYGNRTIAKVRDDVEERSKAFSELYTMQIAISISVVLLYVLYILFFVKENFGVSVIMLLHVLVPLISVSWFFNGLEMFKITVTRNTIIKILTVFSIFLFVKTKEDLWKYTLIMALGTLLSEGYLILIVSKYTRYSFPSFRNVIKHIKPNITLFIPILAVSVYRSMDKLMLKWMVDYEQVGYYSNAEKIIGICLACVTALGQVMLPKMSNLISRGEEKQFRALIKKSFKLVGLITFAMIFGIMGVAEYFVPVFWGEGYEACIPIIKLLSINLCLLAWGNVLKSEYLIPKEKDRLYIISVALGAIVNFFINMFLIPKLFAIGAIIGTLLAELISVVVVLWFVKKELKIGDLLKTNIPYLVIGMIMYFVISFVGMSNFDIWCVLLLQIFVGAIVYIFLVLAYWHYTHDEFEGVLLKCVRNLRRRLKL